MMKHRKVVAAVGVTAALATGGLLGATLGVPSISSAQDAPTATTTPESPAGAGHCRGGGARGFGGGQELDAAAEVLGITVEDLRTATKDGTSLADIAADKGIDKQKVIDALIADAKAKQAERVADGSITQEQADKRADKLTERVTSMVNGEGFGGGGFGHRGDRGGPGDAPNEDNGAADSGD